MIQIGNLGLLLLDNVILGGHFSLRVGDFLMELVEGLDFFLHLLKIFLIKVDCVVKGLNLLIFQLILVNSVLQI